MQAGKIAAKLRDAVLVCFYENGEERARFKNIEIPDELKDLETTAYSFDVSPEGRITVGLHFERGTLPEEFPPARVPISRADKRAARREAAALAKESPNAAEPPTELEAMSVKTSEPRPENEPPPNEAE